MAAFIPVIIALGANSDADKGIALARIRLERLFERRISFTRILWTDPIDFGEKKFMNVLALASTSFSFVKLRKALKDIEKQCGRTAEGQERQEIKMDIDILEYGTLKYHLSDWNRGYVKELMAELPLSSF